MLVICLPVIRGESVAHYVSKVLAVAALAGGLTFGAPPRAQAQGFDIETGVEAISSPNTLIRGLQRLYVGRRVSDRLSFGQGIYTAALGDAGGAFFWGFEGVARVPLSDRIGLSFSGFLGGGGGAGQINGDGLMLRASAALDYRLSRAWDLQLTASWIRITGAPIDGPALGLGVRYRLGDTRDAAGEPRGLEFDALSFYASQIAPASGSRMRSGAAQTPITLIGARAIYDINPRTRLSFSAAGAGRGAQGYMQIMAEARRQYSTRLLTFFVEGGAGFGGGGDVDTGAGLILSAVAGVSMQMTPRYDVELSFGAIGAANGSFRGTALSLGLVRAFNRQGRPVQADGTGQRWAFSAGFSAQQVGANYFMAPGNLANLVVMQESSIDYFVGRRFYVTGTAQTTMAGGVAGYAIGSLGAGYEFPLSDRWSLSLEGHIGVAGGGGVNTAGGFVGALRAELDYQVAPSWRLSLGVGQMRTLRGGGMQPATLTFGIKIPFTTHL
tara:strand:+ start:7435 stop:8925 length:1491 start_codon:yes stop_codon:yes gene_type:complete